MGNIHKLWSNTDPDGPFALNTKLTNKKAHLNPLKLQCMPFRFNRLTHVAYLRANRGEMTVTNVKKKFCIVFAHVIMTCIDYWFAKYFFSMSAKIGNQRTCVHMSQYERTAHIYKHQHLGAQPQHMYSNTDTEEHLAMRNIFVKMSKDFKRRQSKYWYIFWLGLWPSHRYWRQLDLDLNISLTNNHPLRPL